MSCLALSCNLPARTLPAPKPYLLRNQDQVHHVKEAGIEAACFAAGQEYSQAREIMDRCVLFPACVYVLSTGRSL